MSEGYGIEYKGDSPAPSPAAPGAPAGDVAPDKGPGSPAVAAAPDQTAIIKEMLQASAADRELIKQALVKQSPGRDVAAYWDVPKGTSKADAAKLWEKQLGGFVNGAMGQRVQNLEAALAVSTARGQHSDFDKYKDKAFKLLRDGKVSDLSTAVELVRLRSGGRSRGTGEAKGTPVPPATAASPSTSASSGGQEKYRNFAEIQGSPDVQKAMQAMRDARR